MQLLLAIVQADDADVVTRQLNAEGFRLTRINSTGGFLVRGNVTLLLGVDNARVPDVMRIIRATCHTRHTFINAMPWGPEALQFAAAAAMPLEVQVGGATVFSLPVKRFFRMHGGAGAPMVDEAAATAGAATASAGTAGAEAAGAATTSPAPVAPPDPGRTDFVLAIVQNEDAGEVSQALLRAGYRLTHMNTAGGFLRRGNLTLMIGAPQDKIDDVLNIIQANCRARSEASQQSAGMPTYSAAVFVLETAGFFSVP